MRQVLAQYVNKRLYFEATFKRFGRSFEDADQRTACLSDLRIGSRIVTGHIWVPWNVEVEPEPGETIRFTATVQPYTKSRVTGRGRRRRKKKVTDYHLVHVRDVELG